MDLEKHLLQGTVAENLHIETEERVMFCRGRGSARLCRACSAMAPSRRQWTQRCRMDHWQLALCPHGPSSASTEQMVQILDPIKQTLSQNKFEDYQPGNINLLRLTAPHCSLNNCTFWVWNMLGVPCRDHSGFQGGDKQLLVWLQLWVLSESSGQACAPRDWAPLWQLSADTLPRGQPGCADGWQGVIQAHETEVPPV